MNVIMLVYTEVLYRPLFNAMVFLYDLIPWQGWALAFAIIALTLIIKGALYSMSSHSIIAQREMQKLQPRLKDIQEKFKKDKERQSREVMKFYKENKINPFSSCLPLIIQLPILIALYRVFQHGISNPDELNNSLYPFIANPGKLEASFLGILDFSVPNIFLAILAGVAQFFQSWMLLKMKTKKELEEDEARKKRLKAKGGPPDFADTASNMTKQMTYVMPVITVFIALSLPSGLSFYWVVTTLFAIMQQWLVMKRKEKLETAEAAAEQK